MDTTGFNCGAYSESYLECILSCCERKKCWKLSSEKCARKKSRTNIPGATASAKSLGPATHHKPTNKFTSSKTNDTTSIYQVLLLLDTPPSASGPPMSSHSIKGHGIPSLKGMLLMETMKKIHQIWRFKWWSTAVRIITLVKTIAIMTKVLIPATITTKQHRWNWAVASGFK